MNKLLAKSKMFIQSEEAYADAEARSKSESHSSRHSSAQRRPAAKIEYGELAMNFRPKEAKSRNSVIKRPIMTQEQTKRLS